ncbi:di-heme oxidoredictase family protein [Tundrisphaera lichenicola]|uniref:di-heme oxidoredictase family protein n=1 Tax=Tundrisphaera lichenicola TaxID=2029860 RepID=UPI003EB9D95C
MRTAVAAKCAFVLGAGALAAAAINNYSARAAENSKPAPADALAVGSEIFHREWMPDDARGHGGDGLGPAFNDTSCVACHNAGGGGGAGPVSKNIDILSASRIGIVQASLAMAAPQAVELAPGVPQAVASAVGVTIPPPSDPQLQPLIDLHPGFKNGRTVVLHKFGIDPSYDAYRDEFLRRGASAAEVGVSFVNADIPVDPSVLLQPQSQQRRRVENLSLVATARMQQARVAALANIPGRIGQINVGSFVINRSQRNPTPLFGLGLIDAIPESAIEAMAAQQAKSDPATAGRVARTSDGRVGRLGWKGQTANSEDFVLNACAVELGLEVPGHPQAITPQAPRYKATGLDLSADDCSSLVAYVRSLPRPVERAAETESEAKFLASGKSAFASIGCASCHAAKLGQVEGIYSDLLIHDMGDDLGDNGSYDGSDGSDDDGFDDPLVPLASAPASDQQARTIPVGSRVPKGARKNEWRTAPLWGVRDSGPYLHDGRAQTIEQAVALHGGQASNSARKFFLLSPHERLQVEAFLKSLVAPTNPERRQLARTGKSASES